MAETGAELSPLRRLVERRRIGVLQIRGVIGGRVKTSDLVRVLGEIRRNDRVRAVVLDIDSPGGTATGSETLYLAVRKLAQAKPVVAWFQGTGTSGAYFLACGATRVLTFPGALVGSIGVINVRPVAVEVLRRLGTRVEVTKTGPFKDLGAPWREPSDEDRAKERALVDAVFARFRGAVRAARGFDDAALARVTTGEVWLGEEALALGLVDGLADDEEGAVEAARQLASLPHRQVMRFSTRRTALQRLGLPMAGMGPPGPRWLAELEGWSRVPGVRL